MRRTLALIAAVALITTLAACGGGKATSATGTAAVGTTTGQGTKTEATSEPTTAATTPTQTTQQTAPKPRPAPAQKAPKAPAKGKEPIIEAPGARAACIRNANKDFSHSPALNAIIAQCNTLPR